MEEHINTEASAVATTEATQAAETTLPAPAPAAGKSDPLDEITDPVAREEAKKARAIYNRHKDGSSQAQPSGEEFVTKKDFYLGNEKKAISTVQAAHADIKDNWEEIKPFYRNTRGQATPEDIAEDIMDAVAIWRSRNPGKAADPSAQISTITVPQGSGAAPAGPCATTGDPRFSEKKPPSEWYPKKQQS